MDVNQIKGDDFKETEVVVYEGFEDMKLKEEILHGIYSCGYDHPSEIQKRAIVPITGGGDVIAQAQSGTGKTATFAIGVLQLVNESLKETQAIVLSPTRELSQQTLNVFKAIGLHTKVTIHSCVGGSNIQFDIDSLQKKPHVIVGTPGRINDMLRKGYLDKSKTRVLVIDEADEVFSRGFSEQVVELLNHLPKSIQVVLLSATLPEELHSVTSEFMREPTTILVKKDELTLAGIRQFKVGADNDQEKFDILTDIYEQISVTQAVIFCNSRKKVDQLSDLLKKESFAVSSIHGEMQQTERETIISNFRNSKSRILITTDLLARGIDVQQVSLVINYDIPFEKENYIHRIGRSGRFGRKGTAVNFFTKSEEEKLKEIETFYNTVIEELPENLGEVIAENNNLDVCED